MAIQTPNPNSTKQVLIWHRQKKLLNQSSLWSFQLTLLSLFDCQIATLPTKPCSYRPSHRPSSRQQNLQELYPHYFTNKMECGQLSPSLRAICRTLLLGPGSPGLLQPEDDGRSLAFQYPIVSQDEVAPTSKAHPPLTMISYIPLASRSTSSRSSSFRRVFQVFRTFERSRAAASSEISSSSSFVDRSDGNP